MPTTDPQTVTPMPLYAAYVAYAAFARRGSPALILSLLLSLSSVDGAAQPDALVTRLLFEPVPLSAVAAPVEIPLVSFASAETALPETAAVRRALTPTQREVIEADIGRYLARVGDKEAEQGPYSDQLREELFASALLYQQLGEHENALRMFQRALAVSRINFGLEGLDQVPIMQAMASSQSALGKTAEADAMMDAALNLQQKVLGENSIELVPALLRMGEWNTRAFMDRSSILINIPRMNVQNFLTDPRNYIQPQLDVRATPLFKLYQARSNYLTALKSLIDAQAFTHPDLLQLERKLLTNFFLHTHQENILYEPDFYLNRKKSRTSSRLNQNAIELMNSENYDLGKDAHKRSLAYLANDPARDPAALAAALLEEADWDMLFQRKTVGEDKYRQAYEYFAANPALQQQVQQLLYPALPVVLPTYLPAPNSREKLGIAADADVSFFGYIDVSFGISKHGKARRIKVLDKGGEVTRNMEIRLNQYLRNVQFRPRFSGTAIDAEPLLLRYYIGI